MRARLNFWSLVRPLDALHRPNELIAMSISSHLGHSTSSLCTPNVVGWREYVSLPRLGIGRVKAKIDTGARSCVLHAVGIRYLERHGVTWVQFAVHPLQRSAKEIVYCEAPLVEERYVMDSGGNRTLRPVIATNVILAGQEIPIELTLIARDEMGFRMLIGRQAIRGKFLVDAGRSFVAGRPRRRKSKVKPSNKKLARKKTS